MSEELKEIAQWGEPAEIVAAERKDDGFYYYEAHRGEVGQKVWISFRFRSRESYPIGTRLRFYQVVTLEAA